MPDGTYGYSSVWNNATCECFIAATLNPDMKAHMEDVLHSPFLGVRPVPWVDIHPLYGDCIVFMRHPETVE